MTPPITQLRPLALLVPLYRDDDPARFGEFVECLRRNAENPALQSVHVFLEGPIDPGSLRDRIPEPEFSKLRFVPHGKRVRYGKLIAYANRHLRQHAVLLANADIFFDETLAHLSHSDLEGRFLCLSRWDVRVDGSADFFDHPSSQDAWIFQAPLRLFPCDFEMGVLGCDNRLAYEAARVGLKLSNPGRSIRANHLHLSGVRRYTVRGRLPGPVLSVPPEIPEPPVLDGIDAAEATFEEEMGYTIGTFESGASSHNNECRPFIAVPEALSGLQYTLVVSCSVSSVKVEFQSSGRLFILVGDDWYGHGIATEWLREHGRRAVLSRVRTSTGAGFDVWYLDGNPGDKYTLPTQVVLVAKRLERKIAVTA